MADNEAAYFPLFVRLEKKKILVFGGGAVAARRILALLAFGADITAVAPEFSDEVLSVKEKLALEKRCYQAGEIQTHYMVLAATNDHEVNNQIGAECRAKGILVNVASDQTQSDFFFPGIVKRNNIVIGITSSGKHHKEVKAMCRKINEMLDGEEQL